ncbi:MAG TPA: ATP-binding protein [Firmicutes bacterium]|nr:ATP-binding protein [Bacillota bacterium]
MRFDGFAGNRQAKELLSAFVDGGRLPHTLLLEGPAGSGRRTLARLIARAAVCTGEGEKPCGLCPACIKAAGGNHPDILETGGEGAARSFHIETVREIRDTVYVLPNEAPRRVMILAGAQGMTEQAQNALLKILEEPPAHALFILTCENRAQLLPTIQSRAVCIPLGPVPPEEAAEAVCRLRPDADPEAVGQAVAVFGGLIGQAVQGLSDGAFQKVMELSPAFAEAVAAPDELALLRLTGALEKDKGLADGVLGALGLIFRDAVALRFGATEAGGLSAAPQAAEKLSRTLTRGQLLALIRTVEGLQADRRRNINYTLFLTLLCSRLRAAAGR